MLKNTPIEDRSPFFEPGVALRPKINNHSDIDVLSGDLVYPYQEQAEFGGSRRGLAKLTGFSQKEIREAVLSAIKSSK